MKREEPKSCALPGSADLRVNLSPLAGEGNKCERSPSGKYNAQYDPTNVTSFHALDIQPPISTSNAAFNMKKILTIAALLFAALAAYVAAGPYIALHQIKTGVAHRDTAKLSDHIDFPVLRLNLKNQFAANIMKKAPSQMQDTPLASWLMDLGSTLIDGMVDTYVTPEGLASMMEGRPPKLIPFDNGKPRDPEQQKRLLLKDARHSFDSPSQFSVWVTEIKGGEIRFVLNRDGLAWKLTNIVFPVKQE